MFSLTVDTQRISLSSVLGWMALASVKNVVSGDMNQALATRLKVGVVAILYLTDLCYRLKEDALVRMVALDEASGDASFSMKVLWL